MGCSKSGWLMRIFGLAVAVVVAMQSLPVAQAQQNNPTELPSIHQARQAFPVCLKQLEQSPPAQVLTPETRQQIAQLKFISKVLELDRAQPEFTLTFEQYLKPRLSQWRINKAKALHKKHQSLLAELEAKYGIPGEYLIAFWGLETNFGSYLGNFKILDSLATLACDPRRSAFFTAELFQGLQMMESFGYSKDKMLGSWAGAIGQTQFLPSAYNQYAIDGDGDGTIDLWNSEIDALVSSANYLRQIGWKNPSLVHGAYNSWGFELDKNQIKLSDELLAQYLDQRKALSQWQELGVIIPGTMQADLSQMAQLLLIESEREGARYFLTFDNYQVILRWNRSNFYAISVGMLADVINSDK
ncbi:lytic murein transglycosylase [Pelagibaculum spongiae]|nr:lytic murein transglycosylase [Pelagibaculum spongiae]